MRAVLAQRPHFIIREDAAPDPVTGDRVLTIMDDPANYPRPTMAPTIYLFFRGVEGAPKVGWRVQVRFSDPTRRFVTRVWRKNPPPYDEIAMHVDEVFTAMRATAQQRVALDVQEQDQHRRLGELSKQLGPKSLKVRGKGSGYLTVDVVLRPRSAEDCKALWEMLTPQEQFKAATIHWLTIPNVSVDRLEDLVKRGKEHLRERHAPRFTRTQKPR